MTKNDVMKKYSMLIAILLFTSLYSIAQSSGVFPGEPFNGMQVNYTITGATITKFTDVPGFTWTRSLVITDIQKGGTLGISGSLQAGGLGCTITVSINAGGKSSRETYEVTPGTPKSFQQQVTIPKDANGASISINMNGHYSMGGGSRGVVVQGDWDGRWGSQNKPVDPDKYKPAASPVARMKEILQRYSKAMPEGRAASGADNNKSSIFLDGYDNFICGMYQGRVINLLDKLKFSNDPKEKALLEGFEYGPIQSQFGGHQAAVIYPAGTNWKETGTVLDPWITQNHPGTKITYTMAEWTKLFSTVGIDKCQIDGYKGFRFNGSYPDPQDAKQLPSNVRAWSQQLPQGERNKFFQITDPNERYYAIMNKYSHRNENAKVIADCPLNVYLTDGAGRVSGFTGGVPRFEIPGVSMISYRLSDGTYWTELGYPTGNDYRIVLKGTGRGAAKLYAGFNMQDELANRSVYKYSLQVNNGTQFSFDPQQENNAIQIVNAGGKRNAVIQGSRVRSPEDDGAIVINTGKEEKIFDNGNIYGVTNGPVYPTQFVLSKATFITRIENYHYFNYATMPGTIALVNASGQQFGPWYATGTAGQGGVQNATWVVRPNMVLPAGTYTVIDSDPSTWSMNPQSGNKGFTMVWATGQ